MAAGSDESDRGSGILSKIGSVIAKPFHGLFKSSKPVVWDESDEYDFTHEHRGTAIIFNNEYFRTHTARSGSKVDADNLTKVLTLHGFDVHRYDNQTRDDMLKVLKKVAKKDHSGADCFVCVVLSHGDELHVVDNRKPDTREREDVVYGTDSILLTQEVVKQFRDDKCPSLEGKPRIFIIQACRGGALDDGVDIPVMYDEVDAAFGPDKFEVTPSPIYKDFLIMYATPPGYYAFRRPDTGSWLIRGFFEVFSHPDASKIELQSLLTKVICHVAIMYQSRSNDRTISQKKQSPCFCSMLTKDVYFRVPSK